MAFRGTIFEKIRLYNTLSGDYAGAARVPVPVLDALWPAGTGSNAAQYAWSDIDVTLATATTRTLDLTSLTVLGTSITFVEIRGLLFRSQNYALSIGIGGTNGWDGLGATWTYDMKANTYHRHYAPTDGTWTTVSGTKKTIDITNSSGSTATYDLVIIGTLA